MRARFSGERLRQAAPSLALGLLLLLGALLSRDSLLTWFAGKPPAASRAEPPAQLASAGGSSATGSAGSEPDAIHHYTCSMHPSVQQQAPGRCPICGMDLVPVTNAQREQGVVLIDAARRQLLGVRVGSVTLGPLQRTLRAAGRVSYDESKLTDVTLRVRGWISHLLVNQTGQHVRAGQTLFQLYSPELFGAQQDFLLANQGAQAPASPNGPSSELLSRSARQRLHLLGVADAEILRLTQRGAPAESIPFVSPASGFVIEKNVVEGAAVEAGARLFRIAALNSVWVDADVYEADLPKVQLGQQVRVTLDYLPARTYDGKVSSIYPVLDPLARTARARISIANPELELRPGMYASVQLAAPAELAVQVPSSAVVYTGPRRLVFLDQGEGRFRPQEVRVGSEADGSYEVLEGLHAGDRVATSGVFLIAAEARISTAATYWEKAPEQPASVSNGGSP